MKIVCWLHETSVSRPILYQSIAPTPRFSNKISKMAQTWTPHPHTGLIVHKAPDSKAGDSLVISMGCVRVLEKFTLFNINNLAYSLHAQIRSQRTTPMLQDGQRNVKI